MSDVTKLRIVYHETMFRVFKTDVEFCGGYLFVTTDDYDNRHNGRLNVYERYDEVRGNLRLIHSIMCKYSKIKNDSQVFKWQKI